MRDQLQIAVRHLITTVREFVEASMRRVVLFPFAIVFAIFLTACRLSDPMTAVAAMTRNQIKLLSR